MASLLIIEPYYGGSHKQLIDTLVKGLNLEGTTCLVTLPAKKWHWRARTSALRISQLVPTDHYFKVLFASCILNLAELIALRPDLATLHKIVYFHENQLVYPVRKVQNRDFQYGYNQILTCLVADKVIFNSAFNRNSFLEAMPKFMKLQPDCRPVGLPDKIRPKCDILYFPVNFPTINNTTSRNGALHIVWPHRWEHDKDPDTFVSVLLELVEAGLQFKISMLGQSSADVPHSVAAARHTLGSRVVCWGRQDRREDYLRTLSEADVVVSTAIHEFFGVAMLEAVACDCYPLCPDRLVYPEFYPTECIYKSPQHLKQILTDFCLNPQKPRQKLEDLNINLTKFDCQTLLPSFKQLLIIPD